MQAVAARGLAKADKAQVVEAVADFAGTGNDIVKQDIRREVV
jgi:hypothetical protein